MIFKLCGTPKEEYWKKQKLSSTFRPPQSYKPSIFQAFKDFPESSLGLLSTLLALDPASRGFASSALQDDFFSKRPLPCDLSGLPLIPADDDELIQANAQRNRMKMKHRAKTMRERRIKDEAGENQIEEINTSSKQEAGKTEDLNIQIRGPRTKTSTTSSIITTQTDLAHSPPYLRSARDQELRDVPKNKPPLPSSRQRASKFNDNGSVLRTSEVKRSASSREFRNLNSKERFD
jgi:cyclin-dependent kinase 12/13